MKKISTVQIFRNELFKEQKLTIGVDLGDRWSFYCVLDEAGKILLEHRARREKCQETSGGCRGEKVGGTAASVVGRRRGVRTIAQ